MFWKYNNGRTFWNKTFGIVVSNWPVQTVWEKNQGEKTRKRTIRATSITEGRRHWPSNGRCGSQVGLDVPCCASFGV